MKTDTLDAEGKVIEEKEVSEEILKKDFAQNVLKSFLGEQKQIPPMYSAIKVNGKKLYDYARNGEKVEIPERSIKIYDIKLLDIDVLERKIKFRVECSKGTYIRTLCSDIAEKMGNIGYMCALNRVKVGEFKIENAIEVSEIDEANIKVISIEEIFEDNEKIILDDVKLEKFLNGVKLNYNLEEKVYKIYDKSEKFIGLGIGINGCLKRDVIL